MPWIRQSVRSAWAQGIIPRKVWWRCWKVPATQPSSTRRGCSASEEHFEKVRPRYAEFLSNITGVETAIFDSQIPGGMISNMESQLKQQGAGGYGQGSIGGSAPGARKMQATRHW